LILKFRITRGELADMRSLTMACWWPSKVTGRVTPDWGGIAGELEALTTGAETRFLQGASTLDELHRLRSLRQLAKDKARESTS